DGIAGFPGPTITGTITVENGQVTNVTVNNDNTSTGGDTNTNPTTGAAPPQVDNANPVCFEPTPFPTGSVSTSAVAPACSNPNAPANFTPQSNITTWDDSPDGDVT